MPVYRAKFRREVTFSFDFEVEEDMDPNEYAFDYAHDIIPYDGEDERDVLLELELVTE